MLTKEILLDSIKDLPARFSIDDLLDRIILLQKIDIGLGQTKSGKIKTTRKAKEKLKKWLM